MTSVPILMYHSVAQTPASSMRALSVSPDAFAEQMRLLAEREYTTMTTAQLAAAWRGELPLPRRCVLITFDDGYLGVHRNALDTLREFRFTATLFVATGWLRGPHEIHGAALDTMLGWDEVRELAAEGVEIGGHSHSHPQLDQIPTDALHDELGRCKEIITEQLGTPPASFAYPYGYSDRRVRQAVRAAGFTQALVVGNAAAAPDQSPFALRRMTVRRSTGIEEFARLVEGRAIARNFARDRALTQGYALVRGSRRLMRKASRAHV
ncbi:polysaccharide deacetylase family protein [Streptomyces cinnabarinus]|uniref:Polysaccharide deacetylase family protein n=1 Tax=Streptomyces cinnabarinus TaxID=67287 RepID=A0ABY7KWK4_9ACTN|nr:polysaccharide deacetylase family protein [Streptomyces cinnabarinus]WAZ27274.1 polysaccharide deacetylase family protein [Streptomyces cinnabarinus]